MTLLEARGLVKRYGGSEALGGVDLIARPGEILGVAGPNGAGKSTLVRLLAGEQAATAGTIRLGGTVQGPREMATRSAVVHQEAQLFPNLTVEENLLVGREATSTRRPRPSVTDRELLAMLELGRWAHRRLGECPLAVRQRVEIARGLARGADVLLLDEPNSALTEDESGAFFERVHEIAASGRIVLLVTHRLAELTSHAARVVIIRDGVCAAELEGAELTEAALARELVVTPAGAEPPSHEDGGQALRGRREGTPLVRLREWRAPTGAFSVDELDIAQGEILAIVGVEGSGARELVRAVASQVPATGLMEIGELRRRRDLARAVQYLPASRADSLFDNLSVAQNVAIRQGRRAVTRGAVYLDAGAIRRDAEAARDEFGIRCWSVEDPIGSLSGGNQQKVAIAAALGARPRLLVAEEPTRGVDVGSKAEIYALLREYADRGNAVLVFCTEASEVFDVADRVFVTDRGRLSDGLDVADYESAELLAADIAARERHTLTSA
jgi:ABC-type sugar transport system ATPase subunit